MKIHMQLFFFTRTKQPRTFPTICSNLCATGTFKAGCQQLPAVPRANTRTSRVDGDTEQIFRTADLVLYALHVFYTCTKAFNFEL